MRNDFGNRPYKVRFPYKSGKTGKEQGLKDKSKGMEKASGKKAYSSVKTMDT